MIPKRTSKLKILWRISVVPIGITLFWAYMLSLGGNYGIVRAVLIGGFGTTAAVLLFLVEFREFGDGPDDAEGVVAHDKGRRRSLVFESPTAFQQRPIVCAISGVV